ncbi:hypothetical protein B0T14DRAFT_279238 [Immersiella caudata]|uniref:LIM zinc-binding domain-containing protein n=1 Tax=Immersiella caudata TaxID=314043 RepID=A0AA39WDK2_9PEZI|nr:hypothetical protein B0T14DRAFT_279238 [Immersiella caudata]
MATMPRESTFMPTVKCSTCGRQVEISLMGDHLCTGEAERMTPDADETPDAQSQLTTSSAVPPMPAPSLFDRFALPLPNPFGGLTSAASTEKQSRAPPKVDTSAANRAYMGQQGQLTPVSLSSGSRSVSPKTPIERPGAERTNGYFAPKIANDSPPAQSRRPGGYGGFSDDGFEDSLYPAAAPKKQAPNLLERMNTIAPGPFDAGRRPSLARGGSNDSTNERPGTSASIMSSSFDSLKAAPRMPRKNGYGGFGPPPRAQEDSGSERFGAPNRSETFPRPSETVEPPMRTPSAPSGSRPERLRRPSTSQERRPSTSSSQDRPPLTSERSRRPSRGPDTSRPPPPRLSTIPTPTVPSINLAAEFGIGNPYHTPSQSTASSSSSFSQRRPSQASSERRPSQASSRSSPPRSVASRAGRNASDTSGFDSLMADLQSSMSAPKPLPLSPLQPPPIEKSGRGLPPARRPPPPERGYDPRIDPRGRQPVSPLSPSFDLSYDTASLSTSAPSLSPGYTAPPSPRWASPDRSRDRSRSGPREPERLRSQSRPREPERMRSQSRPREPEGMRSQSRPRDNERTRSQSRPRGGLTVPSSRGDCKACRLPITGKSISSADGRLTGRYHKACFVCAECKEPFSSSTFYVLDDRPYCEMDYHKLNGSVCGSCSLGIEGQYLEDESTVKHHVGCFRCGDCGMVLKDGYFEVNGKAFCEKDAWRRVQPPPTANGPMMGGAGSARRGPSNLNPGLPGGPRLAGGFGLPSGNRLGVPGPRPKMEKRMTRLGMM